MKIDAVVAEPARLLAEADADDRRARVNARGTAGDDGGIDQQNAQCAAVVGEMFECIERLRRDRLASEDIRVLPDRKVLGVDQCKRLHSRTPAATAAELPNFRVTVEPAWSLENSAIMA